MNRRTLDCFALVYLEQGAGYFESQSLKKTRITAGDAFFLFPGEWHAYNPGPSDDWEESWFLFQGPLPRFLMEAGYLNPAAPLFQAQDPEKLVPLLEKAAVLSGSEDPATGARLASLLFSIITEIILKDGKSTQETGHDPYASIADQIRSDPVRSWDFKALCRKQGLGYALFRKRFQEKFGLPPYRFLLTERIRKACHLMAGGVKPHAAAYAIGMKDPYHFSRLFKKIMGTAPRHFRGFLRSS